MTRALCAAFVAAIMSVTAGVANAAPPSPDFGTTEEYRWSPARAQPADCPDGAKGHWVDILRGTSRSGPEAKAFCGTPIKR